MTKEQTFLVDYTYDGHGRQKVSAKDEKEAEKRFDDGYGTDIDESGENYAAIKIKPYTE